MDVMAVAPIVMGRMTLVALRQSIARLAAFEPRVPVESPTTVSRTRWIESVRARTS
ncbi:hypothetical protein GCM10027418_02370 [Mariniluteicoccus endophyticus]